MRIALIGLGMVSTAHVKAVVTSTKGLVLHGVCGSKPESATRYIQAHAELFSGGAQPPVAYENVEEVASDPAVDFVVICTPPNARRDIMQRLVTAKKPMLMEKPVERTLSSATALVELCEDANLPLGIVFQHRAREASLALRSRFDSGELGALVAVEASVPWWRPQAYYDEPGRGSYERDGGGVLISQAIHTLDLMLSFTGPTSQVSAMVRTTAAHQMEAEDFVVAGVEFENGAVGSIFASTASFPGTSESLKLHCANATAVLEANVLELFWRDGRHETIGAATGTGGGADPMAFPHGWHQTLIEDFAEALTKGRAPLVTGREALNVHALIESIEATSSA